MSNSSLAAPVPQMASLLVVSRFRVAEADREAFNAAAAEAMAALSDQGGCRVASLGQSTDDPDLLVIRTEWDGVGAYRRALSAFDVKVRAIPLLSMALDEPSAYELVRTWTPGGLAVAPSGLAVDAGRVSLGDASGPAVESVSP